MILAKSDPSSIRVASDCLSSGGVAILPTDTVYGFSASVSESLHAGDKIFRIKGRNENKPMIQLISSPDDLRTYTDMTLPEWLLEKWPGPLTVIVPLKSSLSSTNSTVAFRCPGDLWLRKVIEGCGTPIYSTSVNRSGKKIIETMDSIVEEFGQEVDLIIDDGDRHGSVPSTIVKISGGNVELVREGAVRIEIPSVQI